MKTHVFKRLSALMAGFAVALVGSLSALPQAHAASNYTLDQVGGSANIVTLTNGGNLVAGISPSGSHVSGVTMPMYGFPTKSAMTVNVSANELSSLQVGDSITIPLNYPAETNSTIAYRYFSCGGTPIPEVSLSCSAERINLTMRKGITSLEDFNLSIPVIFTTSRSVNATNFTYVQNQFIGVAGKLFWIDTEPGADTSGTNTSIPAAWGVNNDPAASFGQSTAQAVMYANIRDGGGVWNRILSEEYNSTTPRVLANTVVVLHYDIPLGFEGNPVFTWSSYYPEIATREGDTEYFTQYVGENAGALPLVKVDVPSSAFANTETLLAAVKPGEYALVSNASTGSIDMVANFGSYYNNSLLTLPADSLPAADTQGVTAKEREKMAQLANGGYTNLIPGFGFRVKVAMENVSRPITGTFDKYLVYSDDAGTVEKRTTNFEGQYEVSLNPSGSSTQAQAALTYSANATAAQGLSGTGPSTVSAAPESSVVVANAGSWKRTGYTFTGWNTKADGTGTAYAAGDSVTLPREGVALYAQWKANTWNVTFNKNATDATGSTASLTGKDYESTVTLTANGFARIGYTFAGWNTAANGSGDPYADKAQFTIPNKNTTLYAQWTLNDVVPGDQPQPDGYVKVTFAKGTNGKSLTGQASYWVNPNETVSLTAPTAVPNTGYVFSKWDKSFTRQKFTANTTITAQYMALADSVPGDDPQPDGYVKVTFAPGANGSLSGETSYWVNPAKTVTVTAPTVTPYTGYAFDQWDKALSQKFTANTTITAQYTELADAVPGDQPKPAGYVTVTFDKGANGTLSGETSYWVNPAKTVTLAAPTVSANTGYTFDKWDKVFADTEFTEDTTITALYTVNTYSVSFDANASDASGSMAGVSEGYGSTVTLAPNGFTRTGYTFKGWNTQADGKGVGYADKDSFTLPATDTVLYAQWEKVSAPSTPTATPTGTPSVKPSPTKPAPTSSPSGKPTTPSPTSSPTKPAPTGSPSSQPTTPAPVDTCAADDPSKQEKVYRLYNPGNSEHLFTTDAVEYEVLADKHGWKQEGVAWVGPNSKGSSVGVYRLYNAGLGDHHYTKDQKEAQKLVSEFGWVYDNDGKPLFYSEDNESCARIDVYRQYNGGLKTGQHHYTADKTEWDTLALKHGWQKEGIGWYALSWPNPKG